MEQSGFRPDQQQFYQGAKMGWGNFFAKLEQVLARAAEVARTGLTTRCNKAQD